MKLLPLMNKNNYIITDLFKLSGSSDFASSIAEMKSSFDTDSRLTASMPSPELASISSLEHDVKKIARNNTLTLSTIF